MLEAPDAIILSHQRSGTHFLQSLLSSHPQVHGRGEFILHFRRQRKIGADYSLPANDHIFSNRPGFYNLAIVMYSQLDTFEENCGPLEAQRVIHLLREPAAVAKSVLQMEANRQIYGAGYRAHFSSTEHPPPNAAYDPAAVPEKALAIAARQQAYIRRLAGHARVLTVSYEELASSREVTGLDVATAAPLLGFLGLPSQPLSTALRKTSAAA